MPRTGSGAQGYAGPIVDSHVHPMMPGLPRVRRQPHRPSDYLRAARGLDVRWVAAVAIAPKGELKQTRKMNDQVLALGTRGTPRFFPVCSVHPADGPQALAELDRVAERGAKGLKLHPNTQEFDVADPAVEELVLRATEHRIPVLFDAYSPFDADQPGKFVRLALSVPKARLILAHAHGARFLDLIVYEVLSRYDWWRRNVWVDLSAAGPLFATSPYREQFVWVLRHVGVDRLLFGSDYPLDDPGPAAEAVAGLGFTGSELSRVFYRNAMELFGLDERP
jgi:uncharacterized protein